MRGWVGSRAGLDPMKKIEITCLCRESNSGHPARRPSLYHLSTLPSLIQGVPSIKYHVILQISNFFIKVMSSLKANNRNNTKKT
jgi:hypothetical protein